MKFANKRYYIERYIKCDCCGVLIYDNEGIKATAPDGSARLFCSDWCRSWTALRDSGAELRLPLPRERPAS